jgi:hypothetical protein
MPFEPGQSGNPEGRKRTSFTRDALLLEIKAREKEGDKRGIRKMAAKVMDLAEEGERWAAEYVRDTLDGKPAQQVNLADADGDKLVVQLVRFGDNPPAE